MYIDYNLNNVNNSNVKLDFYEKMKFQTPPDGIPYTSSNKKVEIAVTKIIHAMEVANRGALRNPESLDFYMEMKDKLK